MLRLLLIIAAGAGLGVAGGLIHQKMAHRDPERFYLAKSNNSEANLTNNVVKTSENIGVPIVELPEGSVFKFGTMKHGTKMSHQFPLRNGGTAPLILESTGSTCKCTVGALDSDTLMPGQTELVNLEWRGVAVMAKFGQSATFKTNDTNHTEIKFQIEGAVIDSFVIEPDQINLGSFAADVGVTREFFVYCYADKVELDQVNWSESRTKEYVKLELLPVSTEELAAHPNSIKGYKCILTVLPGVPNGGINGKIQLHPKNTELIDNKEVEIDKLELNVTGNVVSDLSLLGGSTLNTDRNILMLGNVSGVEGHSSKIWLVVRGVDHENTEITLEQITQTPAVVATLGEKKVDATRTMYPITIEIPKGSPAKSFTGVGRDNFVEIVVHAKSAKNLQLPIFVQVNINN